MRGLGTGIIAGLIVFVLSVLASYIYRKKVRTPIVVSPKQIDIKARGWDVRSTVDVHNRSEEMLYAVRLQLEIEGPTVSSENIEIGPKTGPGFASVKVSEDISVMFDFARVDAVDMGGKERVFLFLYRLAPKASESFVVNFKFDQAKGKTPARIVPKVTGYSKKEPPQVLSRGGFAFPFELPKNFKPRRISLLMKKERK